MRRNQFFRNMENLEKEWNQLRFSRSNTRPLKDEDYEDFERAGDLRRARPIPPQSDQAIRKKLKKANFVRWARLQHDIKWAKRELKKMGRNPDDLRWLL